MSPKVLICGFGKMGRVHSKYLKKNNIEWQWHDPFIEKDTNSFDGNINALEDAGFTHVIIATPEGTHFGVYEQVRVGFKAPIMIEKPVIISRDNLSIFKDENLFCGMVERFNPSIQALQSKMISDKVVNIDFTRCSAAPSVSRANIFEDIGIHDLDLYIHLLGEEKTNFNLDICSKTYCLTINKEESIARFIWSKETFFKERKIVVRQTDCTYMVDLQEQTLRKHYLDEAGRNIVEQIYVEKSSPVENQLRGFLEGEGTKASSGKISHELMLEILGK